MSIPILTLLAVLLVGACSICAAAPWISVMDHGAVADGKTDNSAAINRAIEAAEKAGGGTVLVPAGAYLSGPIQLRSYVTLHLEAGATLKASPRREDYPPEAGRGSGESGRPGLITARDVRDVAITGRGVIDGNGLAFVQPDTWKPLGSIGSRQFTRQGDDFMHPRFGTEDGPFAPQRDRPGNLVRFFNCRNVLLSGVTIQNSPTWTVHINRCDGVKIHAVNINSLASDRRVPNDDGIDLSNSSNVLITDCEIQTGDDCVALFGSQNVVVNGCTLRSRSSAVRVGYNAGATRRCVFSNLVIHDSNRGLLVNVRADNSVEDILFANIAIHTRLHTGDWWGKGEPVHISAVPLAAGGKVGTIRNVRFQNIMADSEAGIVIYGVDQSRIRDVSFDNVRLSIRNGPLSGSSRVACWCSTRRRT
jgi:polygalacturonase